MNVITLKNCHCEQPNRNWQSKSLFVSIIIVILFFSSSIAYGIDVKKDLKKVGKEIKEGVEKVGKEIKEGIGLSDKNKQDKEKPIESDKNEKNKEQPVDFLLRKINEKNNYSDDNKVNLPDSLKERLKKEFQNKFPNELDNNGKKRIEADIKSNPWYYFFCSNEKRNYFFATFKKKFQSKKEIIECRKNIYNDFEAVKSFVEKIKKVDTNPKGKGTLISEVGWLGEAFKIPNEFAKINEFEITKEKYEPWNRNIPFFFDNDLEILNQTKEAKKKIQEILNKNLMKRLEKIEDLEKIMKGEFPEESKDSFSVLKEIKNVIKEAPIK